MLRLAVLASLTCAPLLAEGLPADMAARLQQAGFAAPEMQALEQGTVIARVEQGKDPREILAVAAVKIAADRERVLGYYGQMVAYVDGKVTLGFSRFSTPPAPADVAALSLDPPEIQSLRTCRPGQCDLRLGGAALESVRSRIDWQAPDAAARANEAFRSGVLAYVGAYLQKGDAALVTYDDRSQPVSLLDEWRGLLANSTQFREAAPELQDYLQAYPQRPLPGARDVVYWVKENYGMKPVISLVHGVIYQPPQKPDRTLVFQKQIYASHYYDASAAVAAVLDAAAGGAPATYLVYANRSRGDMLKGGFGGIKRKVARDQALKAAKETLSTIKRVLERSPGG